MLGEAVGFKDHMCPPIPPSRFPCHSFFFFFLPCIRVRCLFSFFLSSLGGRAFLHISRGAGFLFPPLCFSSSLVSLHAWFHWAAAGSRHIINFLYITRTVPTQQIQRDMRDDYEDPHLFIAGVLFFLVSNVAACSFLLLVLSHTYIHTHDDFSSS